MEQNPEKSVKTSDELTSFLTRVLKDVRDGKVNHEEAKSITMIVDKINKNSANAIEYKKVSKHSKTIPFFSGEGI